MELLCELCAVPWISLASGIVRLVLVNDPDGQPTCMAFPGSIHFVKLHVIAGDICTVPR